MKEATEEERRQHTGVLGSIYFCYSSVNEVVLWHTVHILLSSPDRTLGFVILA